MAQSNFEERIDTYEIESTNVMTGDRDRSRYLYYQLKRSMAKAKQIDIIVSFLMESGVRMLLNDMKRALDRGVKIRILTGNYLGITQPSALYLIKSELGDHVDLRLYNETSRSFHPKSYIFHYESSNEIYIGSSNISKSALTSGIEWNYRFSDTLDKKNYELFYATFEDLFLNHSILIDDEELKRYSKAWKKPAVSRDLAKYDATEDGEDRNAENVRMLYRPRGAQIEALYALQESRMEGAVKGLVYAATGIGKTYLAAFDSAKYERVLFVAHREEILKQAAVSFKNVRNSEDYGFFDGEEKDTDKSVIFASVATLGRPEYLNETYFPADYFDYVIIDEFHHAVTDQYRRIVDYFQPQFLLGLTATPERMDGKNIYEICDYNVPYQISLKEMLDEALLFVKRNMRTKTIISPTTGRRTDRTDYPITAVREAIINALVHRDYSIHTEGMPIQLIMFEDRIEIHNPGGLYGRITIDQLGKIQPDTRNPVLASALETLGIIENRYSGIPTIRMEMEKYNLRQPEFLDERGSFIVKLYKESKNDYEDMSNDEETNNLIVFCKTPRTRKEICDYLGLNSVTYAIQTYVNPLVEAGVIKLSIPDKPKSPKQLYYSGEREK